MSESHNILTRRELFPSYFYKLDVDDFSLLQKIDLLIAQRNYHQAISEYAKCFSEGEPRSDILIEACIAEKDHNFGISASSYYAGFFHGLAFRHNNKDMHRFRSRLYTSNINLPISRDLPHVLYSDFSQGATDLDRSIRGSPGRDLRSCLIASMPKAASSFLSSLVSSCCQFEIVQVQFGDPSVAELNPRWLGYLNEYGVTTHSHIEATDFNITKILEAGFKNVIVQ